MAKSYDVIVVGAGPGGVCCAALLAKKGLKVLVLDKNERVGGKTMRVSVKGFTCEMWPTGGLPTRGGSWLEAFRALGIESRFNAVLKDIGLAYRRRGGKWSHSVTRMDPYELPDPNVMFDDWGLTAGEREVAVQVLADVAMMPPEKIDALDGVTVKEYMAQYDNLPRPLYEYFAYLTHAFNVGLVDLVPMSETTKAFQRLMDQPLGYPAGGYGRMVEDMAEVLKADGGEVKTRTRVERIMIENGRATGVITRDAVFKAPIVVSNAGIQPTVLKLVGEQHFDKTYASYVRDLLPSMGFTGCRYVLSKPVLPCGLYQIWSEDAWWDLERFGNARAGEVPADVVITATVPTNYDPEMGPPGKQLVVLGTPCSPDPQDKTIRALWKKTDRQMAEVYPEIVPYIESREAYTGPAQISAASRDQVMPGQGGEAVGVGVTVGQCGRHKASAKSPLPGLFYVGFDAGSSAFMGTQQAVDSALKVAPMVHRYHLERQLATGR
jgi:phytoene dehydrogenase-like protein